MGQPKDPGRYGAARKVLATAPDERAAEELRATTAAAKPAPTGGATHQHFGLVIVSCERADLRPLPHGVMIYGDTEQRLEPLPPPRSRASK